MFASIPIFGRLLTEKSYSSTSASAFSVRPLWHSAKQCHCSRIFPKKRCIYTVHVSGITHYGWPFIYGLLKFKSPFFPLSSWLCSHGGLQHSDPPSTTPFLLLMAVLMENAQLRFQRVPNSVRGWFRFPAVLLSICFTLPSKSVSFYMGLQCPHDLVGPTADEFDPPPLGIWTSRNWELILLKLRSPNLP